MIGQRWWGLIVILLLLSVALHHDLLFLMSLLLGLIGAASYLWTRYCLSGVSYRRRFGTTRLFYGEETDLDVEIINAKPLPLGWLRAEDEFPADVQLLTGRLHYSHLPGRRLLINLLSMRWYERVTRHYRIRGTQRGAWQFGPTELISGDIFGLDTRREQLRETEIVLVYPKIVPITALGLPACRPFGDFATPRRLSEDPLRLMGAREYIPGDGFRRIHWKATARQAQLQSKVFEPSAARSLAIFLNINTFEFAYEGLDRELEEFAITAAASVANYAWEHGYQVGLYVNSVAGRGGGRIRLRPARHPDQLILIFEALARVIDLGRWPLEAVLQAESGALPYGTTVVTVTPLLNDRLRNALVDLRNRGHAVALLALGKAHLNAPLPGIQYYYIGGREVWHELESLRLAP